MSCFEFHRFSLALKCQFLSTRRSWLRSFGIYSLVMFALSMFYCFFVFSNLDVIMEDNPSDAEKFDSYESFLETVVFPLMYAFIFIFMLIGASSLFSLMKETGSRTSYLMLSVSRLEKYVVCLLHSIFLTGVIAMLSFVVADVLRVLADLVTGRVIVWGTPLFFKSFFDGKDAPWQIVVFSYLVSIYVHSLYILGGSLFHRNQFLFTSIAYIIESFLVVGICKNVPSLNYVYELLRADETGFTEVQPMLYVVGGIILCLIVLHYWLSYRIFCRMQAVNHKWLNINI